MGWQWWKAGTRECQRLENCFIWSIKMNKSLAFTVIYKWIIIWVEWRLFSFIHLNNISQLFSIPFLPNHLVGRSAQQLCFASRVDLFIGRWILEHLKCLRIQMQILQILNLFQLILFFHSSFLNLEAIHIQWTIRSGHTNIWHFHSIWTGRKMSVQWLCPLLL